MKRSNIILGMLFAVILIVACTSLTVFASETVASGSCGMYLTWVLTDDGTLTISGEGAMPNYGPESYTPWNSVMVDYRDQIITVTIDNGVTNIGNRAFYGFKNLTGVTLPDSVTRIGVNAFGLCSSLTSLKIPDSVTIIDDSAFYGCSGLTSVAIPDSVTAIGKSAFANCGSLDGIWVGEGNPSYANDQFGVLFNKEKTDLIQAPDTIRGSYSILDGVTSIVENAFYDCDNLAGVVFPDSVTTIGESAFYDCDNLASVALPDSVTTIGERAFYDCDNLVSVTFPDSITTICAYTFYDCDNLASVAFPDSVTTIGKRAFYDCDNLVSVTFPDSVTTICEYTFYNCNSLAGVAIPDSVTTFGENAFGSCDNMATISIGSGVSSIDIYSYFDCASLAGIWVDENNANYSSDDSGVLYNKDKTLLIFAPKALKGEYSVLNSTTAIGEDAFNQCNSLIKVMIPGSVASIGEAAFSNCAALTEICVDENNAYYSSDPCGVLFDKNKTLLISAPGAISGAYTIPESTVNIGESAFYNCDRLTDVHIPDGITSISTAAFEGCSNLASITIPKSVTSIGWCSFAHCGLTSITIPESVTFIDRRAFHGCLDLDTIVFEGNAPYFRCLDYSCSTDGAFLNVTATVFYPANNSTWASGTKLQGYGGIITWVSYEPPYEPLEPKPEEGTMPSPEPWDTPIAADEQGDGTEAHPYRIISEEEFALISLNPDAHYILGADFTISENHEIAFSGIFDGNHHTLTLVNDAAVGLFRINRGTIKNLNLNLDTSLTLNPRDGTKVGCICSENEGIVQDCTVKGRLSVSFPMYGTDFFTIGAITGVNGTAHSKVERCWSALNISTNSQVNNLFVGGIAGENSGCISQCLNTGNLNATMDCSNLSLIQNSISCKFCIGGIVGCAYSNSEIDSCIQAGKRIDARMVQLLDGYGYVLIPHWFEYGYIAGGEYAYGHSASYAGSVANCMLHQNSVLNRDVHDLQFVWYDKSQYLPAYTEYETLSYNEIRDWWNNLDRPSREEADDEGENNKETVRYFHSWDPENKIAYFETDPSENPTNLGSQVTEETDTSFLEHVDSLVGTYVLVKTQRREDGMLLPDTLLRIKPVETRSGTVTANDGDSICIDGVTYAISEELGFIIYSAGDVVTYHLYQDKLVGIRNYDPDASDPELPDQENPEELEGTEGEYRMVVTPEQNALTLEIGQALTLTCKLYNGDTQITDWEQPQLTIADNGSTDPISYEGWTQLPGWNGASSGVYVLSVEAADVGTAFLSLRDFDSGAGVDISVEVLPVDETAFNNPSQADWVEKHIRYAKSKELRNQILDGFSGQLNTAFEKIRDDWTISGYTTLDKLSSILELDLSGLNETQEYELLLTQILFSRNGVTSITDTYSGYLSEASLTILRVLFMNEEFTAGVDEQKLYEINTKISDLMKANTTTSEAQSKFIKALDELLDETSGLEVSDSCISDLAKELSPFIEFGFDAFNSYCQTTKEWIMYLAAGEAYAKTSEAFGQMLLQMRSHLDIPSNLIALQQPVISNENFMGMLNREASKYGNHVVSNPLDVPISAGELSRALENFYTALENYKHDGSKQIAVKAADSFLKGSAKNVFDLGKDVALDLLKACPVIQVYDTLTNLFDGTQFIIDAFTGIDERSYHGIMVMRLYCMERLHYITVSHLASSTEIWGKMSITSSEIDRSAQYDAAVVFDEAVAVYRAIRAVATEYAKAYYETPLLNLPKEYHGYLPAVNILSAALTEEQSKLNYAWCHSTYEEMTVPSGSWIIYGLICPTDITVTDEAGSIIAELIDNQWNVAPGWVPYFSVSEIGRNTGTFLNTFSVPETYHVSIAGTGAGEMDAVVIDRQSGEAAYFIDVPVAADTVGLFANSAGFSEGKELVIDGTTLAGETDVHVHAYTEPLFEWKDDYSCVATFECAEGDDSQTVPCIVTSETTPGTGTESGTIVYTAAVEFNGHTYTDTCTVDGPAAGDTDNNGSVDADDAIYLLYHILFGGSDYPIAQECDYDGSGSVDADDAIYLLFHTLFGGEGYPLS